MPARMLAALPTKLNWDIDQATRSIREVYRETIKSKQRKLAEKKFVDLDIISLAIRTGIFTDDGLIEQATTLLAAGQLSLLLPRNGKS